MRRNEPKISCIKCSVMIFVTTLLFPFYGQAQDNGNFEFRYPLDVPMSLSGNYGELRSNHFHAGIDFRIGGVVGAPVYAAADGYVSRISVSPTGYGNALYITHRNGYVSVYGHLHRFENRIREYVRAEQYASQSFVVDICPDSACFPVKAGELIAFGGNTGSSGGPHLHFEVRRDGSTLNLVTNGLFAIDDGRKPVINRVAFMGYEIESGVARVFRINRPRSRSAVIPLPRLSYVAVDAIDRMEGTNAKLAIGEYSVFLDGECIYRFKVGDIPMNESRYLNSLIEYPLKSRAGRMMVKSYVEPGNGLAYKIDCSNNGLIVLNDDSVHTLTVEARDYGNNVERISYKVRRTSEPLAVNDQLPPKGTFAAWHLPFFYKKEGFVFSMPAGALYRSIYFEAAEDSVAVSGDFCSKVWKISGYETALHIPAGLSIRYEGPDSLKSKALLVSVSPSGRIYGAGGAIDSCGYVTSKISSFGSYAVALDTVAPVVRAYVANGETLRRDIVSFSIRDRLSGIGKYEVEIDGRWVLAEFDAKRSRLAANLADAGIERGKRHALIIRVSDNKGNETVVKRDFKW